MNILKDILNKYCKFEDSERTGLFLLDLPTGFGKTHNVFDYIYEVHNQNPNRKILFITNLKKNLEPEKLRERFKDKSEFDKKVIFVDSNVDYILNNLLQVEDKIPPEFKETEEFINLKNNVEYYNKLTKSIPEILKFKEKLKEEIRNVYEPAFRRLIKEKIYKLYKTKQERIKAVQNDSFFNWLPKVYPTVLSSQKQIFFLSVDKFLVKNSPIIENSYYFTDNNFLKNALIIIDEFDASKEIFLKRIIENQLQKKIDLIGLFTQIFTSLNTLELPEIFKRNSKYRENKIKTLQQRIKELKAKESLTIEERDELKSKLKQAKYEKNIRDILQDLVDKANNINKKYEITYFIKTKNLKEDKNFLFHDYTYRTIIGKDAKFIYLRKDEKEKIRYIEFDKVKDYKDTPNIIEYINITNKFINYFKKKAAIIAENYKQIKDEEKDESDYEFLFDNALRTFFNALHIDESYQNYLIDTLEQRKYKKHTIAKSLKDISFYSNGFRYFEFEDSEEHDVQSKIYITSFDTTPEKILLELAQNNFIVGISATARNKSVIGNFALDYLKTKLGTNFYEITKEEREKLEEEFKQTTEGYKKFGININAKLIKIKDNVELELEHLIKDEEKKNEIYTKLEKDDIYVQKRYIRIAKAFDEFIKNDEIYSMICFLNTLPSKNNQNLKTSILEDIFDAIINKYNKQNIFSNNNEYSVRNSYYILGSSNFETKMNEVKSRLSRGEKIFVISTYQTIGAGQNIQYDIPANIKTFKISDKISTNKKDFDAIYLDKPTNLLVNIKGERIDEFNLAKRIFHLEMLFADQEIFYDNLIYEIKRTFKQAYNKEYNIEIEQVQHRNLYKTQNYYNFAAKQIIQAIGRINRTNNKTKNIYIFADYDIAEIINNYDYSNTILLKEFEELIKVCQFEKNNDKKDNEEDQQNRNIEFVNFNSYNFIKNKINSKWLFEQDIEEWKELREFVLKHPTLSEEEYQNTDWNFLYLRLPQINNQYYFSQQNDFFTVQVDFKKNIGEAVSEQEVHLPELMKINLINEFFTKNNYAKSFKPNQYIFSPIIFNNIYKGALGEVIGKLILEEYLKIKLDELPKEIYEKFDYVYKDIYVDFKFWSDSNVIPKEKIHNHIYKKLEALKAHKVFIINILADGEKYKLDTIKDGKIIEVPYLIDKNKFEIDHKIILQLKKYFK